MPYYAFIRAPIQYTLYTQREKEGDRVKKTERNIEIERKIETELREREKKK